MAIALIQRRECIPLLQRVGDDVTPTVWCCRRDIAACLAKGTGWVNWPLSNQTENTQNMVCQLKSVEEVGNLWAAHYATHASEYAAVAFVRPDVQFDVPFPTQVIPRLQVRTLSSLPGHGRCS